MFLEYLNSKHLQNHNIFIIHTTIMSYMLQKSSILRTLEVFFRSPISEHYLMDMSRRLGLAHTSVKKNLVRLVRLGLIEEKREKRGSRTYPVYSANSDSKSFRQYKKIHNLASIFESGLVDFIEDKLAPKAIVVFGSYHRGEDTESSDIDIFVECKREALNLDKFEKQLSRKIEIHFNENFTSYPKELKNNIINGMVMKGFLEGYK